MTPVTKQQFTNSAFWKLMESFSAKGVAFLVTLVLARILTPADYGLIAVVGVFTGLSDILVNSGFSTALIQNDEVEERDFSVILYISLIIAAVLYVIIFFCAPAISHLYGLERLGPVLRVLCLMFFFQAIASVRTAIITRQMGFNLLFKSNLASSIVGGVVGIALAVAGFGVWALVAQQLLQQLVLNVILFASIKWKPVLTAEFSRAKKYFGLSFSVLGSSLLNYASDSGVSLVLGKVYSTTALGLYSKGDQFPRQFSLYTFGSLSAVMLPTFSSYQHDLPQLKHVFRKTISMTAYVVFPIMTLFAIVAQSFILLILGDQWVDATFIMQMACLYYCGTPIMLTCVQLFFSVKRGRYRIFTEVLRLMLTIAIIIVAVMVFPGDINAFAVSRALVEVLIAVIAIFLARRIIDYGVKEVIADFIPPILMCFAVGAIVLLMSFIPAHFAVVMCMQVVVGAGLYVALSAVTNNPCFAEVKSLVRSKIKGGDNG